MRIRNHLVLIALGLALSACATGPRPTLVANIPVNDAGILSILDRFERADQVEFTASYRINVNYGNRVTNATVTQ